MLTLNNISTKFRIVIIFFIMLISFAVYKPGLTGGYLYDDYSNILQNNDLSFEELNFYNLIKAADSGISSQMGRPVSMLSFALNIYFTGHDPYFMKLVNVLIHLLNGLLLFIFTSQILNLLCKPVAVDDNKDRVYVVAAVITSAWLLHPVNLTSVLYIVQRMNLLSTLFTLTGLILYIAGRQRLVNGKYGIVFMLCAIICGILAILSKENGLLIILYILLIEFLFLRLTASGGHTGSGSGRYFVIGTLVMTAGSAYLLISNFQFLLTAYQGRDFTLVERLLTESRVLWFYIYMIFLPNIRRMSLHHDEIVISHGLLDPPATLLAVCGIVLLIVIAVALRRRMPPLFFGVMFFLAGHSMESTILPLELVFEYRNYLPSYGIIFVIFYYLFNQKRFPRISGLNKIAAILLICLFAFGTQVRARQWGDPLMLRFYELERNPDSARSAYEVGRFYASSLDEGIVADRESVYAKAGFYFRRTLELNPANIEALTGLVILSSSNGKPVEPEWADLLIRNLESRPLNYTEIAAFNALLNCKGNQGCDLQDTYINSVIEAVLKNNNIHEQTAAVLYYNLSLYYLKYSGDSGLARKYAERAIAEQPDDRSASRLLEYIISSQNGGNKQSE